MEERQVIDNHLDPYDGSYHISGNDEHLSPDAIWYPCPFFNHNSSQEELLHGLVSSSCGTEEADFSSSPWNENELAEETYERDHLPYYGCGNWLTEFEYSFSDCWGDGYLSLGNGIHNNEGGSVLEKIEDSRQSEQQDESHFRHEEVTQEDYPACDSNPWSYDSWFAHGGKANSHDYNGQETRITPSYGQPEIGVCESIFGYWPCLYR